MRRNSDKITGDQEKKQSINSVSQNSIFNKIKRLELDMKYAETKIRNENDKNGINCDAEFEKYENDYIENLVRSKEWNQLVKNSTSYFSNNDWTITEKRYFSKI